MTLLKPTQNLGRSRSLCGSFARAIATALPLAWYGCADFSTDASKAADVVDNQQDGGATDGRVSLDAGAPPAHVDSDGGATGGQVSPDAGAPPTRVDSDGGAIAEDAGVSWADDAGSVENSCTPDALAELEAELAAALEAAALDPTLTSDPNMTLLLETSDGRRFTHSTGIGSTPYTVYESASSSKLVSAVVILDLVDQGILELETRPGVLLQDFWNDGGDDVTLRHLLSFRSGFYREPCNATANSCPLSCVNRPNYDFGDCVEQIYGANTETPPPPAGSQFYYSSTHLQIAGLLASAATGQSWSEIFAAWQTDTGLFPTAVYDLPSLTNPRIAGGMHWRGIEYLGFLRALYHGDILSADLRAELFANQRGQAQVVSSPVLQLMNEDWAYGLGNWLECPTAIGANTYNCGGGQRNSSPGAYGAYPFLDWEQEYFGVLARQGALGSFREGLAVMRAVQSLADRWAQRRCEP